MNSKNEIIRKLLHILFGIVLILGLFYLEWGIFIRCLFILFLILVLISVLNIKFKIKLLESLCKENEKDFPLKGILFFIVGSVLVMYIFSKQIALGSITILTFGDSVSTLASYFGTRYQINPFRKFKSLFGSLCGFVVAFLMALMFIDPLSSIVGSFFAMLSESISIKLGETDADDNLIVPLAAATSIYLLSKII